MCRSRKHPFARAWLLLAAGLLIGFSLRADDFDTLRLEWRDFTTGGTNLNLADPYIASRVSGAGSSANSYWSSMNKAAGRTYLWSDAASTTISADITTCYSRLSAMAQGWATIGSAVYSNASLAADIVSGLDWMYTNRYNEARSEYNNWWDWEIGVPMALNNCMVMLYPVLSGAQVTNYCNAIDKFSPAVTMTGANRVWKAEAVGVRGVVGRNAAKVAAARDGLSDVSGGGASSVFAYVTTGDGFYRDGSFIQHGKHPYTAGYGLYLFRDVAKMLTWLDGTQWAVTDSQRTNVVRWCYDSYEPLIYLGALPEHLRGREISRSYTGYSAGHSAVNTILRVAQTAPAADADRLKSMIKYWGQADTTASLASYADIDLVAAAGQLMADSSITARGELVGHYQFPGMDRVMHLRPGFGFGLSLFSSRIYNYECINSENWHGWFTAYGMTYLWNSGDLTEFTDSYWPTIDPYHLPGTTVDLTALANAANQGKTSTQPWVGGAVLSNSFGVAGMALDDVNGSLVGYKSWFLLDDEIVCLGAGISCSSPTNVHTTIENRNLHTSAGNVFTVNGTAMPVVLGWSSNLNNVTWCALDTSGGYYFPGGASLVAQRVARTGKWSDINAGGSTSSITRNYLTLVWDHGVAPANGSYAYVILPNYAASAVGQYAANPRISVLTNSPSLQAVRDSSLGILAANFWTDGARTVDVLTASTRAAVIARETNGVMDISVSDPTWTNTGSILVTYARAAFGVLAAESGVVVQQLSPAVQLAVNVNGAHGRSFQARFTMTPAITAVADSAATGGSTPIPVDVLANDITAGIPLTISSVATPAHGTATVANQLVNYLPAAGYAGTDIFNYFITDGQRSATGTVSIAVAGAALNLNPAQVLASSNQVGNPPANTLDNDPATRWSAQGDGQWIQYDLLSTQRVAAVSIAFYAGDQRVAYFDLNASSDGTNWAQLYAGQGSGTTTNLQRFSFPSRWARYVRIVGHGNSQSDWNSITEARVHTGTNSAPMAIADAAATAVGSPVMIDALANDYDPDNGPQALFLLSALSPAHGTTALAGSSIRYQPLPGFVGQDSFNYLASDAGLTATGLVTVTVTHLATAPPVLAAIPDPSVIGGSTLLVTNVATDQTSPPQRLLYSLRNAPDGATINPTNGLLAWRPSVAKAGSSNQFTVVVTQNGWLNSFVPVADACVRDGAYSGSNFGSDAYLAVKLGGAGFSRESYLKFNLAGIPGAVTDSTLQLTPLAASLPGVQAVSAVTNNSWIESALAWTNRPSSGPALATWTPQYGTRAEVPVAGAVQDALLNGGGMLSLRLFATNTTADGLVQYGSREGASANVPLLAVASSTGTFLGATQSFWVKVIAPQPPALAASIVQGRWQLTVNGSSGPDYRIEVAASLGLHPDWVGVFTTNAAALPFTWIDANGPGYSARFYRVALVP